VIVVASKEATMGKRKIRDEAEARACLKAVKAARGASLAQWARDHGVDGRSLNAWRVNMGRRGLPAPRRQRARLVELVPMQASAPSATFAPCFVVRCGKLAVEIKEQFDEAALRRLLQVVTTC
jgi:hypothetical protein